MARMKQILLMLIAVVMVGCGKKEESAPQVEEKLPQSGLVKEQEVDPKVPSPATSTKPEPQTKPKESTEEEIPLTEGDKELIAQAESGDADAQFRVGVRYQAGIGLAKDAEKAAKWFRKAAEQGDADAQDSLGFMYEYGKGVPEDEVTAYAWYNIAAANGMARSKKYKGSIAKEMTSAQIAQAEALVKEIIRKNPKLLKKKE